MNKVLRQTWQTGGSEYGMALATVSNTNDEEKLGRIKVQYMLKLGPNGKPLESDWLQFASPYAGEGYGMFFLPEPGTRALVAYAVGDPSRAYVVGFLWDGKKTPPVAHEDRANVRVIETKNKKRITIDDSEEGKIEILDEKGNLFRINSSSGKIEIECKGGVSIRSTGGESVEIACDGDASIQAEGALNVSAAEVSIKATSSMTLSAPTLSYE